MADHDETDEEDRKLPAHNSTTTDGGGDRPVHRDEQQKRARKRKRSAFNLSYSQSGIGFDATLKEPPPNAPSGDTSGASNFNTASAHVQLPSSLLPSAPAQPNRTQTLPFHHLYNMNSSALINPLMLPGQESTQSARSDQQQQMALLQQLWGLATNPVIATSLGMNLPNHTPVGLATNAVNPSVMLPSSFTNPTTNHNPPLLPGGLNPTLFAGAIPAFVSTPSAPSANALAAAAAATVASADLNVFIQQARTIAAAAIQPQPHALEPPPSLSGLNDPLPTGRPPFVLYISCDDESLSDYQCLVRRQIELFEATVEDVESNAQGRNRPIVLGQVGIRCRHCSMLPPKHRERGAIYYPAKLQGIYQAAQNLAVAHLGTHCLQIPAEIRDQLTMLRERKSSAGGGKKYWADGVRVLGVLEGRDGLRFAKL